MTWKGSWTSKILWVVRTNDIMALTEVGRLGILPCELKAKALGEELDLRRR